MSKFGAALFDTMECFFSEPILMHSIVRPDRRNDSSEKLLLCVNPSFEAFFEAVVVVVVSQCDQELTLRLHYLQLQRQRCRW
jgi:hypothetical protein